MKFAARDASGARTFSTTAPVASPRYTGDSTTRRTVGTPSDSTRYASPIGLDPSGPSSPAQSSRSGGASTVVYPRGASIFSTSEGRGQIYIVRAGCVRLYKILPDRRQITLALLGQNTVFTQEEVMDGIATGARADALTEVTLAVVDVESLAGIIADSPQLAAAVVNGMTRRFTELQTLVEHLLLRDSTVRLATTLVALAGHFGRPTADGLTAIALPLTHQSLANMIGSNRVTVTRKLLELQENGSVRALGRNAIAIDVDRLRGHARVSRKIVQD